MSRLDPRLNAYRADLADLALQGQVEAMRFVPGEPFCIAASSAPLRRAPSDGAALDTEALRGEEVRVFETTRDGWSWAQLAVDRYVGWMPHAALAALGAEPTHRVCVLRTLVFTEPDIKSPPLAGLPLGAVVTVVGAAEDHNARYALIDPAGAVVDQHLAPLVGTAADWTGVAELFVGTPYLWGGKTSLGIDCSGLIQIAFQMGGVAAPRDTDMQAAAVGERLDVDLEAPQGLARGDLLFWDGHAGIMVDATRLLHANAFHMMTAVEPVATALARIAAAGLPLRAVRRIA